MTRKLFWEDPYRTECEAKVSEVKDSKVKLNQTVFFAFSGGQASDSGTIDGVNVKEAITSDKDIIYTLEQPPNFKEGDTVVVKIDWNKRYKIMKLHSATHIVYYVTFSKIGKQKVIGSNVSEYKGRFDFLYDKPISEVLPEIEQKTNEIISKNMRIEILPDEKNPEKRWWICGEWKMPCGGTHPKSTGEIGKVRLKRKNIGRGKERIEITLVEGG